jgi:hypothetical protein
MSAFGSMLRHQVLISGFLATLIAGFDALEEARAQALLSRWTVSVAREGGRIRSQSIPRTTT